MRANEEALRATNLDCLGRATKIHGDIFVSNAKIERFASSVIQVMVGAGGPVRGPTPNPGSGSR